MLNGSPQESTARPLKRISTRIILVAFAVLTAGTVTAWRGALALRARLLESREAGAVAMLGLYVEAQKRFIESPRYPRRKAVYANPWDGAGFPDLAEAGLLPEPMARAKPGGRPLGCYYFIDILGRARRGAYDRQAAFGLCAFPSDWPTSGRHTFIVDESGEVWQRDTAGTPFGIFPADPEAEGWWRRGEPAPFGAYERGFKPPRPSRRRSIQDYLDYIPFVRTRTSGHGATSVMASMRTYLTAQNQFHRSDFYGVGGKRYANPWDGHGFVDLFQLPDGEDELRLIDRAMSLAVPGGEPRVGYWLVDMVGDKADGPYDYEIACGLCAFPVWPGNSWGMTYIIDVTGVVYEKDTSGIPVFIYPADPEADGWRPMGY